ncbi:hypothetical protein BC938DRAFT_482045 [Jimgerdemannia flammicorona]|uniref:Ribosomal RNA-processing protein 44 n=1 Tax=Jimgerdemannia flammicorona TaxID=994334 RepID=A0A433QFB9_9FUNG|nr:hypothetical protein BC938DRAFT_482045 [Jimgerdemannia flammicorona]
MLRSKAFLTQKKNGKVVKVVKEHYLRDDIWCAAEGCIICGHTEKVLSASPQANTLLDGKPHYIVPDTNIDLMEHSAFKDVIVLQTVLEELRHLSLPIHTRLRKVIADIDRRFYVFSNEHHRETYIDKLKDESPNDRNDRARTEILLRIDFNGLMASFQHSNSGSHELPDRPAVAVVMISDDANNRAKAKEAKIQAFSVKEYVGTMVNYPELMDMVAEGGSSMDVDHKFTYEEVIRAFAYFLCNRLFRIYILLTLCTSHTHSWIKHLTPSQIAAGIKAGNLSQGKLNISMHNHLEVGYISYILLLCLYWIFAAEIKESMCGTIIGLVDGTEKQIYIIGRAHLNRAVQDDVVAVQILPKSEWRRSPSVAIVEEEEESVVEEDAKKREVDAGGIIATAGPTSMETDDLNDTDPPQPTGRVVGFVRRNWRPYVLYSCCLILFWLIFEIVLVIDGSFIYAEFRYCGYIDKSSIKTMLGSTVSQNVLFCAMDHRVPKISIRTRQAHILQDQRIVVVIDSWPKMSRHAIGHFVKALGPAGDKDTEMEVLLLEHDVPYQEFAPQVLKDLPAEGDQWTVKPEHLEGRADLRDLNICSIDPPACTDIDDALHVKLLPNGNYEVGVHIADVSYFVKPDTPMDIEAAHRGTTVYLVDKRIDMLPSLLGTTCSYCAIILCASDDTTQCLLLIKKPYSVTHNLYPSLLDLCSLRSNVDRLAFSCLWEMSKNAEIVNVDFKKSVIRSRHSFTYEEAQNRMDDMYILRHQRMERGGLTLASPEVRFKLENDSQDPVDVEMKELKETNALVEEFMLLANVSVAEKIYSKFPDSSMLRRHAAPPDSNFEALEKAISPLGLALKCGTSKALSDSLDMAILPHDPYFNKLLRIMATRCMMQAVYFCSGTLAFQDFRHYGLATDIYTHFTSPIRRYPDIVVHRLLAVCINPSERYGPELTDKIKMKELCDVLNHRHRMAQQAARSSVELYTNIFFKNKVEQEEGHVVRILKNGFIVLVRKYGIEGIVYASSTKGKPTSPGNSALIYNPKTNSLDSPATGVSIRLFDQVVVQITVDEDLEGGMRQKLKMFLVEPVVDKLSVLPLNKDLDASIDTRGKNVAADEDDAIRKGQRGTKKIRVA